MKIAALVARILLGLILLASGVSGFFLISHPPPAPPGLASAFQDVFFRSRWVLFVDGVELICGVLLLSDRYVPLALVTIAAIMFNMFAFHITMFPVGIFGPLVLLVLWILIAMQHRSALEPLLVAKPARDATHGPG